MSFDDYVNHIRKKYRLALAITIIQNKPENKTSLEYIENLRNNIENKAKTDLDSISINSNDFLYEDDDITTGGKEINSKLEQTKAKTINYEQNNKEIGLNDKLLEENSFREDKLDDNITTELNKGKSDEIGNEINHNFEENHNSYKFETHKDKTVKTRAIHDKDFNKTSDIVETRDYIHSPNILENFDLSHAAINTYRKLNDTTLHMEVNEDLETHNNMTSPNILENFDYENVIEAHTVETRDKRDDFAVNKQPHKKASNIRNCNTNTNKISSKPNLIIEDTQLIDSDDASNLTDCEIANNSMNNITDCEIANHSMNNIISTDENNKHNMNFNTQTTFCDVTQLETINLINEDKYNNKVKDYRYFNEATEKAKSSTTYCDLTSNLANFKQDLRPIMKDKCEILNKNDFPIPKAISNNTPKDTLKRKLNEANDTENDKEMLSKINRADINDSEATELYTVYGLSQPLSHISQSQVLNTYNIDPKHITKAKQPKILTKEIEEDYYIQLSPDVAIQDTTHNFDDSYNFNLDININTEKLLNTHPIALYEDSLYNNNGEQSVVLKNASNKAKIVLKEESKNTNKHEYFDKTDAKKKNLDNSDYDKENVENDSNTVTDRSYTTRIKVNTTKTEKLRTVKENSNEITLNVQEISRNDAEVIPFKVIEEMNRVKVYLTRNNNRKIDVDSFSADSGFISDSQIKSSLQLSSQSSQNCLNQSAHCLLEYLLKCPLLTTNVEFTEEISMVLCELIDKLHAEENYPPFLDLILEKTKIFLEEISNGYNDDLDSKTEQSIHRFLLLNKSINIIKFSLEKLTKLLEKIHENLTKSDPYYEITNAIETQNITYVFHILEIILKRYFKQKDDLSSQSTQPTENFTKKTYITDIWRAKWNSKFKTLKELPSDRIQKEDVTEQMAIILNKIIINCMEGYSLVSFAALQCFNLLQS